MTIERSDHAGIQMSQEVVATASLLAEDSRGAEPAIQKIYQFPASDEARLVYVDSTIAPIQPGERIAPFYFAADPASGVVTKSAVALIAPEDDHRGPLPESWGTWDDASVLWERKDA